MKILQGVFETISTELYNSTFKKCKIAIFAFDKNKNKSNITPQSFEIAKNSLFNIPIVAKYDEDVEDKNGNEGDLEGHNTRLKKDKNGDYIVFQDTVPLGLVPESAKVSFEEINEGTEDKPDIKTYVVIDGALLWMRYSASKKIEEWLEQGVKPTISMEIGNIKGKLEDNAFRIDAFEFQAICALGSDKNPCFPKAEISEYELKLDFKESYSEMLKDFKDATQEIAKEEGGVVLDKLALFAKFTNLTEVDYKDLKANMETLTYEEIEIGLTNLSNAKFELTQNQLKEQINKMLYERKVKTKNWNNEEIEVPEFYALDIKGDVVIAVDYTWDKLFGITYVTSEDSIALDFENAVPYIQDYRPKVETDLSASFAKDAIDEMTKVFKLSTDTVLGNMEAKVITLNENIENLKTSNIELAEFKSNVISKEKVEKEKSLYEAYSKLLTSEEIATIKKGSTNFSLEDLENGLSLLVGKKMVERERLNFKKSKKENIQVFEITHDNKPTNTKSYSDILEKYKK